MATSTVVAYLAGLGLARWDDPRLRRLCLIAPITVDLSLLGFFKYANFGLHTANSVAAWLHVPLHLSGPDIVLPVGISFYTFHTITYIVDAYRRAGGRIEHEHFPEARHGFAQLESPATDKCVAQVLDFVGRQTGPPARS